jgi:hypothetical protein
MIAIEMLSDRKYTLISTQAATIKYEQTTAATASEMLCTGFWGFHNCFSYYLPFTTLD